MDCRKGRRRPHAITTKGEPLAGLSFFFTCIKNANNNASGIHPAHIFCNFAVHTKTIKRMKNTDPPRPGHIILSRPIFSFYEQGLRYVPIFLMLCHWYGVFNFHDNPREILVDIRENEPCIVFLYFMTYVFPLLFMMPASYFFRLCWIWRIPFLYIIGVNAVRICYRSWLITNQMYTADVALIITTLALYLYAAYYLLCRNTAQKPKS